MNDYYDDRSEINAADIAENLKKLAKKTHAEKGIVKLLLLGQILAFAGLFITGRALVRDLMYSRYRPDYAYYMVKVAASLAVIVIFGIIKRRTRGKGAPAANIHVEPVQDNAAYINGNFLILEKDTGAGRKKMSFELDRIKRVRSGGGITSFMYNDPSQGFIEFSTEDNYEPGIAVLLRARGIGTE